MDYRTESKSLRETVETGLSLPFGGTEVNARSTVVPVNDVTRRANFLLHFNDVMNAPFYYTNKTGNDLHIRYIRASSTVAEVADLMVTVQVGSGDADLGASFYVAAVSKNLVDFVVPAGYTLVLQFDHSDGSTLVQVDMSGEFMSPVENVQVWQQAEL